MGSVSHTLCGVLGDRIRITPFLDNDLNTVPMNMSYLLQLLTVVMVALMPAISACSVRPGGQWIQVSPAVNTTIDSSPTCQLAAKWTPGNGTQCFATGRISYCPGVYNATYGVVAGVSGSGLAACCPYDLICQTCVAACEGFQSFTCKGYTTSGACIVDTCLVAPQYTYQVNISASTRSSGSISSSSSPSLGNMWNGAVQQSQPSSIVVIIMLVGALALTRISTE